MNMLTVIFILVSAILVSVSSVPRREQHWLNDDLLLRQLDNTEDQNIGGGEDTEAEVPTPEHGDRHRRVTCDLMSVSTPWGSLGHAACAAHCLAMNRGYRGGRCIDGVCNCRK